MNNPKAGIDYDPNAPMCQDDYEYLTGTGQYSVRNRKIETLRNDAVRILTHYIKMSITGAGLRWDSDNDAEVELIVDSLIGIMREVAK